MVTVLVPPRNSSAGRISTDHSSIRVPSETLKIPQRFPLHTLEAQRGREDNLTEYRVLGSVISDDVLPDVKPLPWRQCAVLMVLASAAVYGLGFLVVTAFDHLFKYLQL